MASKTGKEGYDYEFVALPEKSLECPVCLLTLRDPHMISCCGNEFCQRCIDRVQRDGKPCPVCNEPNFTTMLNKKLVREINALIIRCPQKEQGCDWEGELGQLQNHLNPGAGVVSSNGCGFVLVECPYQCGVHVHRRLIQEHEIEICPKRPIEMQMMSLLRKFETLTVEFKAVATENQEMRADLEKVQKVNKDEMSQVKQELNEVKKKNEHLQKANEEMQKMCDELKCTLKADLGVQNAMQKSKLDDLEKKYLSLHTHTMPLPVPPFYLTLPYSAHYLMEEERECRKSYLMMDGPYVVSKRDQSYCSEPFFSHPGGYKMCVKVYYPKQGISCQRKLGNSQYEHNEYDDSSSLKVYVSILRGEFDDQLHWPFDGSITVQMYNYSTKQWSNERTLVMNERECNSECVKRCIDGLANPTREPLCFNLLPLSQFESGSCKPGYSKDDSIKLRITEVKILK